MTWEFKGANTDNTGPPWVLTEPTSASAGDVMILYGGRVTPNGVYSAPADFTVIDDVTASAGTDQHCIIAYKIRGADEGAGYTLNYTGASAASRFALMCFGNTSASCTADVAFVRASHFVNAANAINTSAQPITTSASAALIVLCESMTPDAPGGFGAPAGYNQALAAGGTVSLYMAYATATAPGVHAPGAFTHTDSSGDNDIACFTLAFSQATAAAGGSAKTVIYRRIRGG